jgi:hypothetical protein
LIIALAGRRIDAADAKQPRFPIQNVPIVRMRVRAMLENQGATAVVCSAACGADLIALSEAGSLGLKRKVVLPCDRKRFKEISVADRPGEWGPLYEQTLDQVEIAGNLVNLGLRLEKNPYSVTNRGILDEAIVLGKQFNESVTAVLVWDGVSRRNHDITEAFAVEARNRGLPVLEVSTK